MACDDKIVNGVCEYMQANIRRIGNWYVIRTDLDMNLKILHGEGFLHGQ